MFSRESLQFQSRFHLSKLGSRHPKDLPGNRVDLEIQIFSVWSPQWAVCHVDVMIWRMSWRTMSMWWCGACRFDDMANVMTYHVMIWRMSWRTMSMWWYGTCHEVPWRCDDMANVMTCHVDVMTWHMSWRAIWPIITCHHMSWHSPYHHIDMLHIIKCAIWWYIMTYHVMIWHMSLRTKSMWCVMRYNKPTQGVMTHSYVWHDAFTCLTGLTHMYVMTFHVRDMTPSWCGVLYRYPNHNNLLQGVMTKVSHDAFTKFIHMYL